MQSCLVLASAAGSAEAEWLAEETAAEGRRHLAEVGAGFAAEDQTDHQVGHAAALAHAVGLAVEEDLDLHARAIDAAG